MTDDLIARLEASVVIQKGEPFVYEIDGLMGEGTTGDTVRLRNPDGPEAATRIRELEARVEEATNALEDPSLDYEARIKRAKLALLAKDQPHAT